MKNSCFFLIISLMFFAGCTSPRLERQWKDKPVGGSYKPVNIYAADSLPADLRRVVVLPLFTDRLSIDFMPEVGEALINALRRQGRFEVLELDPEDVFRLTGRDSLTITDPIPPALLQALAQSWFADAVLQVEITAFRPYKPMVLGLQSRLFHIDDRSILWSCDEIFDAGNEKVVMGARHFAESELDQPYPLQTSYSTLLSPQRFASYVGFTLFRTIPLREGSE